MKLVKILSEISYPYNLDALYINEVIDNDVHSVFVRLIARNRLVPLKIPVESVCFNFDENERIIERI